MQEGWADSDRILALRIEKKMTKKCSLRPNWGGSTELEASQPQRIERCSTRFSHPSSGLGRHGLKNTPWRFMAMQFDQD